MDFNLNPQICSKSNLFSLNFLITSFYNFQKGFEHMLGYSSFEGLVQNRKDQTLFQAFNGSTFSLFKQRLVSLLIEKYIDYFLFNRTNIAYHYHNTQNDKLFLIVQRFHHSTNFEIVCASLPTVIILLILIPSTLLLYSLDEELEPLITYKVVGHQ
mgnify:CR=1 FL=1